MADDLEAIIREKMRYILAMAGEKVIQTDDMMTAGKQSFAEVRADESGPAGDQYPFLHGGSFFVTSVRASRMASVDWAGHSEIRLADYFFI